MLSISCYTFVSQFDSQIEKETKKKKKKKKKWRGLKWWCSSTHHHNIRMCWSMQTLTCFQSRLFPLSPFGNIIMMCYEDAMLPIPSNIRWNFRDQRQISTKWSQSHFPHFSNVGKTEFRRRIVYVRIRRKKNINGSSSARKHIILLVHVHAISPNNLAYQTIQVSSSLIL